MAAVSPARPLFDVHCHVLPDLDDGAADDAMALTMLRASAEAGVTGMVVTPHSLDVTARGGVPVLYERLEHTRARLAGAGITLTLYPGMEVHLTPDVAVQLASGAYLSLNNGRYALIEFDASQWATYTDESLFAIALQGTVPLLAHVERIMPLQEQPERVEAFVGRGMFTQITAISLLGGFGPEAERCARLLLQRGLVHVVASDTHRPDGNRQPLLAKALPRLRSLVGEEAADTLLYENPAAVVAGRPLRSIQPRPERHGLRRFLPFG